MNKLIIRDLITESFLDNPQTLTSVRFTVYEINFGSDYERFITDLYDDIACTDTRGQHIAVSVDHYWPTETLSMILLYCGTIKIDDATEKILLDAVKANVADILDRRAEECLRLYQADNPEWTSPHFEPPNELAS